MASCGQRHPACPASAPLRKTVRRSSSLLSRVECNSYASLAGPTADKNNYTTPRAGGGGGGGGGCVKTSLFPVTEQIRKWSSPETQKKPQEESTQQAHPRGQAGGQHLTSPPARGGAAPRPPPRQYGCGMSTCMCTTSIDHGHVLPHFSAFRWKAVDLIYLTLEDITSTTSSPRH